MKSLLKNLAAKFGYSIKKIDKIVPFSDIRDAEFIDVYNFCKPYTMTTIEPMYALFDAVKYILSNNIPGSFVECGVWRGGSSMLIAKMLSNRNITDRKIYMYDTYEGMPEPESIDKDFTGIDASVLMKENEDNKEESVWCLAQLENVRINMLSTGFPIEKIQFIKGKVEDTLAENLPQEKIALLRLDTDWYESTKHELLHLYPLLTANGVLIIDDYGHWEGCRKAVDEYFNENNINILMSRIDYTVRMGLKTGQ